MTAIKSLNAMLNLKYVGIFDSIQEKVFMIKRNQGIYIKIVCF